MQFCLMEKRYLYTFPLGFKQCQDYCWGFLCSLDGTLQKCVHQQKEEESISCLNIKLVYLTGCSILIFLRHCALLEAIRGNLHKIVIIISVCKDLKINLKDFKD